VTAGLAVAVELVLVAGGIALAGEPGGWVAAGLAVAVRPGAAVAVAVAVGGDAGKDQDEVHKRCNI